MDFDLSTLPAHWGALFVLFQALVAGAVKVMIDAQNKRHTEQIGRLDAQREQDKAEAAHTTALINIVQDSNKQRAEESERTSRSLDGLSNVISLVGERMATLNTQVIEHDKRITHSFTVLTENITRLNEQMADNTRSVNTTNQQVIDFEARINNRIDDDMRHIRETIQYATGKLIEAADLMNKSADGITDSHRMSQANQDKIINALKMGFREMRTGLGRIETKLNTLTPPSPKPPALAPLPKPKDDKKDDDKGNEDAA